MKTLAKFMAVAAIGLVLTACSESQQEVMAQAQSNLDSGEYRTVVIHLKNFLKQHPKSADAWALLGRASLASGMLADAETQLHKAKKFGASANQFAVPLARALLAQNKPEELLTTIKLAAVDNDAERTRLLIVRGDAFLASDKPGQAEKSYQEALKQSPESGDAAVGLANVAAVRGKMQHASELLGKVKNRHPENARAWLLTARIAMSKKHYKDAQRAFERALESKDSSLLPQQQFLARAKLAETKIRQDDLKSALADIKPLNKASPDQPYANYLRALVAYKLKDYNTAQSRLQRVLRVSPRNSSAQLLLGAVNYAKGSYGQAKMYLSNILGINENNKKARKLLALTLYKAGQKQQALEVARPMVGKNYSDAQLLALLSKAGKMGPQADMLASNKAPQNEAERLEFARRYIIGGKPRSAITLLEQAPANANGEKDKYKRAQLLMVALLREGDTDKAVAKGRELIKANPETAAPHVLLGGALAVAKKTGEARDQFQQALKFDTNNKLARMSLARLARDDGRYDDAIHHYRQLLENDPKYGYAMIGIARVEAMRGNSKESVEWVEKAREANPDALRPRMLLTRFYTRQGKFKKAMSIAREMQSIAPNNPAALNALGVAQMNIDHKDAAIGSFKKAVDASPKSARFRTNLARAQMAIGQFDSASDNLESVVYNHEDYVPGVALYALSKLKDDHLYQAVALAKSLRDKQPVAAYSLEGDLYLLSKRYDDALAAYGHALDKKTSRALVVKFLRAAAAGRQSGQGKVGRVWLKAHPDDGGMREALGSYYLSVEDHDRARDVYANLVAQHPSDVAALNNLAWLYTLEPNDKAVELAQKAHKLAPDASQVTDTLGWALLKTGDATRAVDVLRQARKQAPDSTTLQYHLAAALARVGNKNEARDILNKLLAANKKFENRDKAEALYAGLKEGSSANAASR